MDQIHLVGTDFVSMLTQRPSVRRLLPLESVDQETIARRVPKPETEN